MCYSPNPVKDSGDRYGRTGVLSVSSARHFTTVSGQEARAQGGQLGQTVGGGHFTSGHRGRGHGGQSPHFLSLDRSTITGWSLGIDALRTYWLMSGTGGHSVLSIYCPRSGQVEQGGIDDFNTYFVISGKAGHIGHTAWEFGEHSQG